METIRPGRYRHFKGNEYQVLHTATHSETLEPMVVYRALYGERGVWVRPAAMWTERVERDGYSGPRFQYVEEDPLSLEPVSSSHKQVLWNFLQKHLYELTRYYPDEPDDTGCYPYRYFEDYFTDPTRTAYFLQSQGHTVGFVLLNRHSVLDRPIDHAMAELCVFPAYRRQGFALQAAQLLFAARPGRWEIKYHRENRPAKALWTSAAARYAPTLHRLDGTEEVLSFTV